MLDEGLLAGAVPFVLAVELGDHDVGLVQHHQEVVGEEVEQGVGGLAPGPTVDGTGVVLDPVAEADLLHHLQVVAGAHAQALGLEQLALLLELLQPLLQLDLDALDGQAHPLVAGDVVAGRQDHQLVDDIELLAGERVDQHDALDLVAEHLDADGVLLVGGVHLEGVAPHPEAAPGQVQVVALVADVDQLPQDRAHVVLFAHPDVEELVPVLLGRAQPVDGGHRGDHDDVPPRQQGGRRGVAEALDLVVDRRVLLDVGVARRQVRLGLVVVVVGDEVLDLVLREEGPELVGQLGGERLVRGHDQRRALELLDGPADGGALAAAGDAQQGLELLPRGQSLAQPGDGLGLVAGRGEVGHHLEAIFTGHPGRVPTGCDSTGPSVGSGWVGTRRRERRGRDHPQRPRNDARAVVVGVLGPRPGRAVHRGQLRRLHPAVPRPAPRGQAADPAAGRHPGRVEHGHGLLPGHAAPRLRHRPPGGPVAAAAVRSRSTSSSSPSRCWPCPSPSPTGWRLPIGTAPALWTLLVLAITVGLPFLALSTASPTFQRWFSLSGHRHAARPVLPLRRGQRGQPPRPAGLPAAPRAPPVDLGPEPAVEHGLPGLRAAHRGLRLGDPAPARGHRRRPRPSTPDRPRRPWAPACGSG